MLRRTLVSAALMVGVLASPAAAQTPLGVGEPVSGHVARGGNAAFRLHRLVRTGDELVISIGYYGTLCVLGPVGGGCSPGDGFEQGGPVGTVVVPYNGPSGYPVVQLAGQHHRRTEAYTLSVERVIRRIALSADAPSTIGRDVRFAVAARYGDKAVVPDGLPGTLTWRYVGATARQRLSQAAVAQGVLAFGGRLPATALGRRVQLRACVPQSGGNLRCLSRTVRVAG